MAGHSKWNNIKRKKEKTDAQKAKMFTKMGREMSVAVKESGADPENNGRLRDLIAKAKSMNVPNDNINRVIKKAGEKGGSEYEHITYEGYGPGGVAVIVSALSDNRNRTAGELRHYFDKNGGNLGQTGSVMFLFEQKGVLIIEVNGENTEKIIEDCIDSDAQDFEITDEAAEIITLPSDFMYVRDSLEKKGYGFVSAEIEFLPLNQVKLGKEDTIRMEKLIDMLEENEDVQNIWHTWAE